MSQPNLPPPLSPDTRPLAERLDAVALPSARGALAHLALSAIEHYVAVLDLDGTVLEINDRGFVPLPRPREDDRRSLRSGTRHRGRATPPHKRNCVSTSIGRAAGPSFAKRSP